VNFCSLPDLLLVTATSRVAAGTDLFIDCGAELTIIAASGNGPYHGLPGVSRLRSRRPTLTVGDHTLVAVESPRQEIGSSKWGTRGWTYQEVMLSTRRLVFTDSQVYFQCRSSYVLEGWKGQGSELARNSRLLLAAFSEISAISRSTGLYNRLEEYYRRELSYPSDILNAFTGIFRAFRNIRQQGSGPYGSHFYGISIIYHLAQGDSVVGEPRNAEISFALGLAWKVYSRDNSYANFNKLGNLVASNDNRLYRLVVQDNPFPSWTWAAFKASQQLSDPGRLHFPYRFPSDKLIHGKFFEINLYHRSGAKMSLVDYLKQEDDYTKFLPIIEITSFVMHGSLTQGRHGSVGFSAFPGVHVHLHEPPEGIGGTLIAICVGYIIDENPIVIIVEEVETGTERERKYRHVGVCSWSDGKKAEAQAQEQATTSLQIMSGRLGWHRQTLRLV